MKVVVFEIEEWERGELAELGEEHEVEFVSRPLDAGIVDEHSDAEIVSVFIYSDLDSEVLSRLKQLRMIATRSAGFDHIDLAWCRQHDVAVANVPSYAEATVAEHVFALLLALSHRLVDAVDRTRRGDFSLSGLRGFDLRGKSLGVVGTGRIGRHVIRIARGFGMRVLAFDVHPDTDLAEDLEFEYVSLEELLSRADIVTLHVPKTPETEGLISTEEFERMRDGAVLINTSRGGVVDSRALLRALAESKVAAAGLDVLEEEPTIREEAELLRRVFAAEHDLDTLLVDHILLRLRNVIITPHSAFDTEEAVDKILATTRANIDSFVTGKPTNLVG